MEADLAKEIHDGLQTTFGRTSGCMPPPGFLGGGSLLGRLHRELRDRSKHNTHQIRMVKSQEISLESGPAPKRTKLGGDAELVQNASAASPGAAPRAPAQRRLSVVLRVRRLDLVQERVVVDVRLPVDANRQP